MELGRKFKHFYNIERGFFYTDIGKAYSCEISCVITEKAIFVMEWLSYWVVGSLKFCF